MEPETPTLETANEPTAPYSGVSRKVYGALAVSLVFAGGAIFAFEYLKNSAPPANAQQTAAAQSAPIINPYASLSLQAQSAVVIDLKTGKTLFSLNADTQRPLASITKVAMALVVSHALSPDTLITVPYDTAPPGAAERLAAGEVWKEQDIMTFTLVASSNGGADILAAAANDDVNQEYPESPLTSSTSATVWRMNDLAQSLGLHSMYFVNDNGLDVNTTQSGGYGSANDVAKLITYAASTSLQVFSGTTHDDLLLTSVNGEKASAYNTDTALGSIPGLIMGKTGYTDLAGGNLAVMFDVGPAHPVVAVVLGSTEDGRFSDMKQLVAATINAIGQGE